MLWNPSPSIPSSTDLTKNWQQPHQISPSGHSHFLRIQILPSLSPNLLSFQSPIPSSHTDIIAQILMCKKSPDEFFRMQLSGLHKSVGLGSNVGPHFYQALQYPDAVREELPYILSGLPKNGPLFFRYFRNFNKLRTKC